MLTCRHAGGDADMRTCRGHVCRWQGGPELSLSIIQGRGACLRAVPWPWVRTWGAQHTVSAKGRGGCHTTHKAACRHSSSHAAPVERGARALCIHPHLHLHLHLSTCTSTFFSLHVAHPSPHGRSTCALTSAPRHPQGSRSGCLCMGLCAHVRVFVCTHACGCGCFCARAGLRSERLLHLCVQLPWLKGCMVHAQPGGKGKTTQAVKAPPTRTKGRGGEELPWTPSPQAHLRT